MRHPAAALLVILATALSAVAADDIEFFDKPVIDSAETATKLADQFKEKGEKLGPPKLLKDEHGLAVDRTDLKNPKVTAFVGPSWFVPTEGEHKPGTAGPMGLVLDRGTGRFVCRAHGVEPMPDPTVQYVQDGQLSGKAGRPGDSVGGGYSYGGASLSLSLDVGKGKTVAVTIQPGNPQYTLRGQKEAKIRFGDGWGKMVQQTQDRKIRRGNKEVHYYYLTLQAMDNKKTMMATARTNDKSIAGEAATRFRDVLEALQPRPAGTRIWPADARPWVGGVEGWGAPSQVYGGSDVAIWNPFTEIKRVVRGIHSSHRQTNQQVFVAAKIMHPYELPPRALGADLESAKVISSRPVDFKGWVGTERVVEFQGSAQNYLVTRYVHRAGRGQATTNYRARVLDLRDDVRRMMVRCQSPAGEYKKYENAFEKILAQMELPGPPMDEVVVPLEPTKFEGVEQD